MCSGYTHSCPIVVVMEKALPRFVQTWIARLGDQPKLDLRAGYTSQFK